MISLAAILCVFLPFVSGLSLFFSLSKLNDEKVQIITIAIQGLVTLISLGLLIHFLYNPIPLAIPLFKWIHTSFLTVQWALRLDKISLWFLCLLNVLSFLIYLYSTSYMAQDSSRSRFYIYLSFFVTSMALFVTAESTLQLLFGWEFIGLCSFLLISFWYDRPAAVKAAYKSLVINRIGDVALIGGVLTLLFSFHTSSLQTIFAPLSFPLHPVISVASLEFSSITLASALFVIAALAKSAQFGFHTWLPDAMEAPTPVSALLHSATLVTAGVFLLIRLSPLLDQTPLIKHILLGIGLLTSLLGATAALMETNIKRILAFSTISQLGFMMVSIGLGLYVTAFLFLLAHAFSKALLFLCAGSIIHAADGEQNIFEMPKFKFVLPLPYAGLWIGLLSLCGFPFLSGFFAKEKILETAFHSKLFPCHLLFICLEILFFLTICYSARLVFVTFHKKTKKKPQEPLKQFSWIAYGAMGVLALGAIGLGVILIPYFDQKIPLFLLGSTQNFLLMSSLAFNLMGFGGGVILYTQYPKLISQMLFSLEKIYLFFRSGWYIDTAYQVVFVTSYQKVSKFLSNQVDEEFINNVCINGLARGIKKCNDGIVYIQSGNLMHYLLALALGIILFMGYLFVK
ncbi:MAG: NADH-quinone oxidoreductase subunit L [Alphaproteobacteria bacterium]